MKSSGTGTQPESRSGRSLPQQRPLDIQEAYFIWLYKQVFDLQEDPAENYLNVCGFMHQVAFRILVPHDANRAGEAAGLRNGFKDFAGSIGPLEQADLMRPDASVFEVLVALTDRANFIVPLSMKTWFRVFLENLGLDKWNDKYSGRRSTFPIERIINTFNNREYSYYGGNGGIFPLTSSREDQRGVELWYQMGAYMTERGMY